MAQYQLNKSSWDATSLPKQVGNLYNIGIADPSAALAGGGTGAFYGYIFRNEGQQSAGMVEKTDVAAKSALQNYGSPNLTDRDLSYYPRVTDGDFSGGGYQEVFIDPTKYFDSDLDPRIPGFLQLRAQWTRLNKAALTLGSNFQIVSLADGAGNPEFYVSFGESNGNVYTVHNGGTVTFTGAVLGIDIDGTYLYGGQAARLERYQPGVGNTVVSTTLNGTAVQWWVVNQGTAGYFAYYLVGNNSLYKMDLTLAFPIAAGSQPQVPFGSNAIKVQDLVEYQNGIAILTNDVNGPGFDVWFHDGTNLTRIIRVEGYTAAGVCSALGNLFVGAYAVGQVNSPILALVSGGQFQVVAKPGSPFPAALQGCQGPRASGQYVYWPITYPSIKGISSAVGVILQYDVLAGSLTHLPNQDGTDFTATGGRLRSVAIQGDSVACCYANGTTGVAQYQISAFGTIKYQTVGWLCSSLIDFSTPGIAKRFRRVEVKHSPLNAGESIMVEAFVDQDPLAFTTALTPTATSPVNTTVGSSVTALTFGADTVGKTMYFAIKLTAGTNQATTPRVAYISVEVGGTRTWEFDLDCTSKRRLLNQASEDQQGVTGKDLRYLIRNAYENGNYLTLFLVSDRAGNVVSYTVAVESEEAHAPGYVNHQGQPVRADEEWVAKVVLRQVS